MAKFTDKALTKLGATRLYELGAANQETYSTEDDFVKWKEPLWEFLFNHFASSQTDE